QERRGNRAAKQEFADAPWGAGATQLVLDRGRHRQTIERLIDESDAAPPRLAQNADRLRNGRGITEPIAQLGRGGKAPAVEETVGSQHQQGGAEENSEKNKSNHGYIIANMFAGRSTPATRNRSMNPGRTPVASKRPTTTPSFETPWRRNRKIS